MFYEGAVIGKLTLVEFHGRNKNSKKLWLCRCECGNMAMREEGNLKATKIPHCGCSPGWKGHNKRFNDISGQKFGRLTVRCFYSKNKYSHNLWLCDCECGNQTIVSTRDLTSDSTKSCGCLAKELTVERSSTHGKTHHRLYRIYAHIKDRCLNPNDKCYKDYGGRGIQISDEWDTFEKFFDWANNNGYEDALTVERIDVNGNYEPTNCCWATMSEQNNNKRNNLFIEYKGETKTLKQWAEKLNINYSTLYGRIVTRGWDVKKAMETR